jgi:hypothetical protein
MRTRVEAQVATAEPVVPRFVSMHLRLQCNRVLIYHIPPMSNFGLLYTRKIFCVRGRSEVLLYSLGGRLCWSRTQVAMLIPAKDPFDEAKLGCTSLSTTDNRQLLHGIRPPAMTTTELSSIPTSVCITISSRVQVVIPFAIPLMALITTRGL